MTAPLFLTMNAVRAGKQKKVRSGTARERERERERGGGSGFLQSVEKTIIAFITLKMSNYGPTTPPT